MFQNRLDEVHMVQVNKVALNRDDNKQVIQSDGVSTLAHRHKDVKGGGFSHECLPMADTKGW